MKNLIFLFFFFTFIVSCKKETIKVNDTNLVASKQILETVDRSEDVVCPIPPLTGQETCGRMFFKVECVSAKGNIPVVEWDLAFQYFAVANNGTELTKLYTVFNSNTTPIGATRVLPREPVHTNYLMEYCPSAIPLEQIISEVYTSSIGYSSEYRMVVSVWTEKNPTPTYFVFHGSKGVVVPRDVFNIPDFRVISSLEINSKCRVWGSLQGGNGSSDVNPTCSFGGF